MAPLAPIRGRPPCSRRGTHSAKPGTFALTHFNEMKPSGSIAGTASTHFHRRQYASLPMRLAASRKTPIRRL
jgi:hypothetical protein